MNFWGASTAADGADDGRRAEKKRIGELSLCEGLMMMMKEGQMSHWQRCMIFWGAYAAWG